MEPTIHRFRVAEARRVRHPVFKNLEKHYLTVRAVDIPKGISTDPNARDPEGLNRTVYRSVKKSLLAQESIPGSFDLMNKGITILADKVQRVGEDCYDVHTGEGQGIVDGGHTYRLICEALESEAVPADQHVEVHIKTGVPSDLITDIARGLNTGIQVQAHSLANLDKLFDWMKQLLREEAYFDLIAWKESDDGEYDVRDLICVMEALNPIDYPNDCGTHPIHAYEKWSKATKNFIDDASAHERNVKKSKFYRIGMAVLKDGLVLLDRIKRDFRDFHNQQGGRGGRLNIVEEASASRGDFQFPFSRQEPAKYRLTKGAAYPIFAAFRNAVEVGKTGKISWKMPFEEVLELWNDAAPELVRETMSAVHELGPIPDRVGKSRQHWSNLHRTLEVRLLRKQLATTS